MEVLLEYNQPLQSDLLDVLGLTASSLDYIHYNHYSTDTRFEHSYYSHHSRDCSQI
jgi:hypothetical protein